MDRRLVAHDRLHPSGAQYATWVEQILPVVEASPRSVIARPTIRSAALELVDPLVGDPELVGDLVVDGVGDGRRESFRRPVRPDQRRPEDRDLARDRGAVGGPARPRHALVEAVQAARTDATPAVRGRLLLDDDRDAAELVAEGAGSALEGVDHISPMSSSVGSGWRSIAVPAARPQRRPSPRRSSSRTGRTWVDRDATGDPARRSGAGSRIGCGRPATRRGANGTIRSCPPCQMCTGTRSRRGRSPTA